MVRFRAEGEALIPFGGSLESGTTCCMGSQVGPVCSGSLRRAAALPDSGSAAFQQGRRTTWASPFGLPALIKTQCHPCAEEPVQFAHHHNAEATISIPDPECPVSHPLWREPCTRQEHNSPPTTNKSSPPELPCDSRHRGNLVLGALSTTVPLLIS